MKLMWNNCFGSGRNDLLQLMVEFYGLEKLYPCFPGTGGQASWPGAGRANSVEARVKHAEGKKENWMAASHH
jgi:hypothetical protein